MVTGALEDLAPPCTGSQKPWPGRCRTEVPAHHERRRASHRALAGGGAAGRSHATGTDRADSPGRCGRRHDRLAIGDGAGDRLLEDRRADPRRAPPPPVPDGGAGACTPTPRPAVRSGAARPARRTAATRYLPADLLGTARVEIAHGDQLASSAWSIARAWAAAIRPTPMSATRKARRDCDGCSCRRYCSSHQRAMSRAPHEAAPRAAPARAR